MTSRKLCGPLLIMVCSVFLFGCSGANDPDGEDKFDGGLIGEWYRLQEHSGRYGQPRVEVVGMRIRADGEVNPLGIRSGTGELAVMDMTVRKRVRETRNGALTLEVWKPSGGTSEQIYFYRAEGDTLTLALLGSHSDEEIYVRSALGTVVVEPLTWQFSTVIRDESDHPVAAHNVYGHPAAYATPIPNSELWITAYLPEGEIFFELKDFQGVGEYGISPGERILILRDPDSFIGYITDPTSPGTVVVDRYDEAANVCSGTFSALVSGTRFGIPEVLELREGKFSVPIYRP